MKVSEQMKSRLTELLTKDAIDNQIDSLKMEPHWYKSSYKPFIKYFQETKGDITLNAWTKRVALVYSWLPTVPLKSFKNDINEIEKLIANLSELEKIYYDADLSTIGRTVYLGEKYHEETNFPSYKGFYDSSLRQFLEPTGSLLHGNSNLNTQLASTTKFLHFMCPNLFPIFDRKVCKNLFGTEYLSFKRYHAYVFGLQEYLEDGQLAHYIKDIARELKLSQLYIVDLVIFNLTE